MEPTEKNTSPSDSTFTTPVATPPVSSVTSTDASDDMPSLAAEPDSTSSTSQPEPVAPSPPPTSGPESPVLNSMPPEPIKASPDASIPPAMPSLPPTAPPERKRRKGLLVASVAVLVIAIAASVYSAFYFTRSSTTKPAHIKIGVMMAFSGGSSSMGYGAMKGVQLAKKQLGADNIDIIQMDSKCDPKAAADAMKRLIAQKVAAVIGEGCSSASIAALPLANNSKTVMISPSASSTTLSIPDDYFFRVVPPDSFQGQYDAQAIYDRGIRTVAVFYTNEPYGTSMNKVFQEKFEGLGGKVVATASAQPDVIDLTDQMQQLKAANPQAIFFAPNSVVSGTAAMKIGRQVGIVAPYFGADILYNTTIIDNAPTAVEGLTITSFPTGTKAFKQALLNEYGVSEQLYAAPQAYDAFHAIYMATQKGASTGEQIKAILPTLSFDGVSAHIKFDQNGEISDKTYKYDLLQIKNGTFITLD